MKKIRKKHMEWWSSLSINEQKYYISKHPFFSQMGMDYFRLRETSILQVYEYCKNHNLIK